jgi:hypothetical protein
VELNNDWMQAHADKVPGWIEQMESKGWVRNGTNWLQEASGDQEYALWLILCDQRCGRMVGIGIRDIEDWTWADAFESSQSPKDAVEEALENAGLDVSLLNG